MFHEVYKDMTDLSYQLTKKLVYARPEEIDVANSMDFQIQDIIVEAESAAYEFDLKDVWVTPSRWSTLVRQYIDPIGLEGFLEQIQTKLKGKKRGQAVLRTQNVAKRTTQTNNKEWRRWGSCMLGFEYRALPKPTLVMHSRTTYLGYIGQLDLALAHVLAREIAERVGIRVEDIAFKWYISAAQFHSFKSLAWFFQHEKDAKMLTEQPHTAKLKKRAPVLYQAQVRYQEFQKMDEDGILYCDLSFSQQLRIRRRLHTEVHGPEYGLPFEGGTRLKSAGMAKVAPILPNSPVSGLTFAPLNTIPRFDDEQRALYASFDPEETELDEPDLPGDFDE